MAVGIQKHNLSVVHFVPFAKGTVDAGAATGVRRRFFGGINVEARPVDDEARRLLAQPSALCKAHAVAERR